MLTGEPDACLRFRARRRSESGGSKDQGPPCPVEAGGEVEGAVGSGAAGTAGGAVGGGVGRPSAGGGVAIAAGTAPAARPTL
ncbi:MAG: hypothetical protein QOK40_435, partial [Miltoncostaeaceae bacterium]|nr:hypothetical protein [Miltoncostaeaceae bacterium]